MTYGNVCEAGCAGITEYTKGECEAKPLPDPGCVCIALYDPVCGTDNRTYGNSCEAGCAGVGVASTGECETIVEPEPCVCPLVYAPVCGKDNTTYSNDCFAECAGVEIASNGTCSGGSAPCICTKEYAPVCGDDGVTYGNTCMAECANVTIVSKGECPKDPGCCAANEKCCGGSCLAADTPTATLVACDADTSACCKPEPSCESQCPVNIQGVCGADGNTYASDCAAKCAGVDVVSQGACPEDDCCGGSKVCCGTRCVSDRHFRRMCALQTFLCSTDAVRLCSTDAVITCNV